MDQPKEVHQGCFDYLQNVSAAMLIIDNHCMVKEVKTSEAYRTKVVGLIVKEVFKGTQVNALCDLFESGKVLNEYEVFEMEYVPLHLPVRLQVRSYVEEGEYLVLMHDISEQKRLLNQLAKRSRIVEHEQLVLKGIRAMTDELIGVMDLPEGMAIVERYLWELISTRFLATLVLSPATSTYKLSIYSKETLHPDTIQRLKNQTIQALKDSGTSIVNPDAIAKHITAEIHGINVGENGAKEVEPDLAIPIVLHKKAHGVLLLDLTDIAEETIEHERYLVDLMLETVSVSLSRIQLLNEMQQTRTESLVQSLSNGVVMFDKKKRVILTNPKAIEFTGLPKEGYYLEELLRLFEGVDIEQVVEKALQQRQVEHIREAIFAHSTYEVFVRPVSDYNNKIIGGAIILHDITHLKEIDQMKTEFVSVASHQLRTPLTAIKLFAELFIEDQKLNEEQKEFAENIYKSTNRMIGLVNDLLNVSRLETGRLRVATKATLFLSFVKNIVEEIEPVAQQRDVEIKTIWEEIDFELEIDSGLMRQVIHNLVSNAVKYSKEGTDVEVQVEKKKEHIRIEVRDKGIGIPKELQKRIFEKFFRTDVAMKYDPSGSGLGLYIAKMIVQASGGSIGFSSKEDVGTTFFVELPQHGMLSREGERSLAQE